VTIDSFKGEWNFLSNFYPAKVVYEGIEYPTAEHAFQAAKSPWAAERITIAGASLPSKAKQLGRRVSLRSGWENIKLQVMKDIVRAKFAQNADLQIMLMLGTGDAELIEGNDWGDEFWGVCNGKGENHLGKILMEIREELSQQNADH